MCARVVNLFAVKVLICFIAASALTGWASAQTAPAGSGQALTVGGLSGPHDLSLLVNKSAVLSTNRAYRRISVGQPDIIEANAIGPMKILVTAKKAGATQLIIWDDQDNSQMIDVLVQNDLRALRELYPTLFPGAKIEVVNNEGTIALTGHVPNLQVAEQAATLAQSYGNKVLNLLEVAGGQQIILQVRFAEVSRSVSNALGVQFALGDGVTTFGSNIGNPAAFSPATPFGNISRSLPESATLFGGGTVGTTSFELFVTALRQNNLLRILAEPNLVATSGQEASFLAGGEYPIPIAQGGAGQGNVTITIEYKEFGVRLNFVPIALGNGKIRMKVAPEVSDLDYSIAVRSGGLLIPGLTTRRVGTTVEMAEGQTFAIAGLLNSNIASNKDVTPLLGDLPVLGPLFRSVRYQRKETELVVLVTPKLAGSLKPGDIPTLPGEHWRSPTEAQLFLFQDIGGPVEPNKNDPPRPFIGRYGFAPATQPAAKVK
jgi:pilus assembly protein CpaC